MNRSLLLVAVIALGGCPRPKGAVPDAVPTPTATDAASPVSPVAAATTVVLAPTTSPTTTASTALPSSASAAARVQAILPHWIDLLERADDATFIDEAVVPEELAKVLAGKSKAELVTSFREDKRAGVLKMLNELRGALPTKTREESDRTLVTYELRREKGVTFVVVGPKVYIKN